MTSDQRAGGSPEVTDGTTPDMVVGEALNEALMELTRVIQWVTAERMREVGFVMAKCPCCVGTGTVTYGDTCAACHGARWLDEDGLAAWEDSLNVR